MPKVSIIIPIYNEEKYVKECLNSIVNQTLEDIEIICVDDGSTDNSPIILNEFAKHDPRIRVIYKQNTGYGHSMNIGLDNATGEFVGIVEADDYIKANMMEKLYNLALEYNVDVIKADFEKFYGKTEDRKFEKIALSDKLDVYHTIINPEKKMDVFYVAIYSWAGIYKREFLENNHIRHNETPGASYQDNGFWFQVFTQAKRVYFTDQTYYMLRRDNPNSSIKSKEKVYCMCEEYAFIRKFLLEHKKLYQRFQYFFSYFKFINYFFTLNRIDYKFKEEFIFHFSKEIDWAIENQELDKQMFTQQEQGKLELLRTDPHKYFKKYYEIDDGFRKTLERYKNVIVYGAGFVGQDTVEKICNANVNINTLAYGVSDKATNPKIIKDIPVYQIEELVDYGKDCLVLIAISEKHQKTMKETAIQLGYEHVMIIE